MVKKNVQLFFTIVKLFFFMATFFLVIVTIFYNCHFISRNCEIDHFSSILDQKEECVTDTSVFHMVITVKPKV